jgi:hypothetical protein
MTSLPSEGVKIVNQRTGEQFVILPVTQKRNESTLTKALAALAVAVMITLAVSILCRLVRKLFV